MWWRVDLLDSLQDLPESDIDLYTLLRVAPTASQKEIEAAMRRLTDAHGPGSSSGDAKLYEQARKAYDVLKDPVKRARYDQALQDGHQGVRASYTCRQNGDGDSPAHGLPRPDDAARRDASSGARPQTVASCVFVAPDDGFFAAETSYGLWTDPTLQQHRLPADDLIILRSISTGAFGDVWLGQYETIRVAVKKLKLKDQTQANAVGFAAEIVRMTQLKHPKITTFVGAHWTKLRETCAVAEFMTGGDLRTLLQSSRAEALDWADFKCQLAMDVVDALSYLQTADSVVESFKSRNVLLDGDDGNCKLSVFAAARGRQDLLSRPGHLEWLSPEILLGESGYDAAKCAIYLLGVLLCELDTTRKPFWKMLNPDGSPMSSFKTIHLVALGKLRPSVSDACPESIASLASECMAFDPQARPTAAIVASRLRGVLQNESKI